MIRRTAPAQLRTLVDTRTHTASVRKDATTTLRLPPRLRARVRTIARQTGRSPHSLIVEAVERYVEYEEQMRSLARDGEIETSVEACRAEDVYAWLDRLKVGVRSIIALSGGKNTPAHWE